MYVQEWLYIQLKYVQMALLQLCVNVCCWLIYVQYVIDWVYLTYDVHLCEYHVITGILTSLFVSYNITTSYFTQCCKICPLCNCVVLI